MGYPVAGGFAITNKQLKEWASNAGITLDPEAMCPLIAFNNIFRNFGLPVPLIPCDYEGKYVNFWCTHWTEDPRGTPERYRILVEDERAKRIRAALEKKGAPKGLPFVSIPDPHGMY